MSKKKKSKTAAKADANLAKVTGTDAQLDPVTDKDSTTSGDTSTSGIVSESKLQGMSLNSIDPNMKKLDANDKSFTNQGGGDKPKNSSFGKPKNAHKGGRNKGKAVGKPNNTMSSGEAQDKRDVSSSSAEVELGRVISVRSNRTLTEYTKPEPFNLSILGFDAFTANLEWKLDEEIRKEVRNNVRSNFIGDNVKNLSVLRDLNKLQRKIIVHPVGSMKNGDAGYAAALYSPQARFIELDNAIVNIRQAHYENERRVHNAIDDTTEGHRNSFWPWSSSQDNMRVKLPYIPSQVDDIKLFSLDGGAMLKSSNRLETTAADRFWDRDNGQCYVLPGVPGFNHYESCTDIANGNLTARHLDARRTVNRQFIYSGDRFTSTRHHSSETPEWMDFIAPDQSEDVIYYRRNGVAGLFGALNKEGIIGEVNIDYETDHFTDYPDLQYAVLSNDFNKLYLKHIANITSNVDNPYKGQLAGLRDKQAFYNAVMSAIHFGTFFRCLLYAVAKTYRNAAFVKSKVGVIDYVNNFLHSLSPQKKETTLSFLKVVSSLIRFIPFNKYSVDNFKVWFDTSKNNPDKDAFFEGNPVYSIRALFCGMSNIMGYAMQPHASRTDLANHYIPRVINATAIPAEHLENFHVNQWGFYVKTLSTQVPIFVPHGDSLCNFFTYFDALFTARPIRHSHTEAITTSMSGTVLVNYDYTFTAMLDPLNYTAFAGNFFCFPNLNLEMSNWFRSYIELVTPFYDYIKSLNCNNATIAFDDNVDFDIKEFYSIGLSVPDYKQHIISWFNQSPRLMLVNPLHRDSAVSRFATAIALVLGHRPLINWVDSNTVGVENNFGVANLLPRVGAPLALSDSYYDYGTMGDMMYNTATAWAVSAPSYRSRRSLLQAATLGELQFHALTLDAGCFLDGTTIYQPWDLYEYFWYPSIWNLPYYPQRHTQLVPGYDFSQADAGIPVHERTINIDGYYNGGNIVNSIVLEGNNVADVPRYISYPTFSAARDAYVEEYFRFSHEALDQGDAPSWSSYPEVSCMRLTYGSSNRDLVWNWQWIAPNIPGWLGTSALVTRQNAISIFTGRNIGSVGLPSSYANVEFNPNNRQARLYRSELSKDFTESLGLPYLPFLVVSRGAALYLDQVYSYIPYFTHKIMTTDIDLSEKFRNLTDVITKLHTGLYDGEAYPSSDGWGNDLLSHPDKQNVAKELNDVNK